MVGSALTLGARDWERADVVGSALTWLGAR